MIEEERHLRLFVKSAGQPSMAILKFLRDNIDMIKDMGYYIVIIKIDAEKLKTDGNIAQKLDKAGIARLPSLVTPGKKIKLGKKSVKQYLETELRRYEKFLNAQSQEMKKLDQHKIGSFGDTALNDFYAREADPLLWDGKDDEGDDEGFASSLSQRIAQEKERRKINTEGYVPTRGSGGMPPDNLHDNLDATTSNAVIARPTNRVSPARNTTTSERRNGNGGGNDIITKIDTENVISHIDANYEQQYRDMIMNG